MNEPTQLGVRQAIETALYSMIMEGAMKNIWTFQNREEGREALDEYNRRRNSPTMPAKEAEVPETIITPAEYNDLYKSMAPRPMPKPQ